MLSLIILLRHITINIYSMYFAEVNFTRNIPHISLKHIRYIFAFYQQRYPHQRIKNPRLLNLTL